jgi:hypothetical protein
MPVERPALAAPAPFRAGEINLVSRMAGLGDPASRSARRFIFKYYLELSYIIFNWGSCPYRNGTSHPRYLNAFWFTDGVSVNDSAAAAFHP